MIKVNGTPLVRKTFPDKTPVIHLPDNLNATEQVITWLYDDMAELFTLYALVKQIRKISSAPIRLVLPYVPNGRQDRIQYVVKDVLNLEWFGDIINSLNFTRVTVIDPHSEATMKFIRNCHAITNEKFVDIARQDCNPDILFYPDKGAYDKYSQFIKSDYAYGKKVRNWVDGELTPDIEVFGDVAGKSILIVDDISSYGGTFYHSAKKLKELGASDIYLLITHCENNILKGDLIDSGLVEQIYTTDSIYRGTHTLIKVIHNF